MSKPAKRWGNYEDALAYIMQRLRQADLPCSREHAKEVLEQFLEEHPEARKDISELN